MKYPFLLPNIKPLLWLLQYQVVLLVLILHVGGVEDPSDWTALVMISLIVAWFAVVSQVAHLERQIEVLSSRSDNAGQ